MRICSGKFEAGMEVMHIQGGKKIRLAQPQQMMAQERHMVEEAYAGDIIGVFDPGIFSIGDTIETSAKPFRYEGIPTFAPEHFARVRQIDTMKRKQFVKGINQIAQEGAIQIFQEFNTGMEEIIVGVVGVLQFDVLKYRLENEYNVEIRLRTRKMRTLLEENPGRRLRPGSSARMRTLRPRPRRNRRSWRIINIEQPKRPARVFLRGGEQGKYSSFQPKAGWHVFLGCKPAVWF